jgi:CRISPR-associated protein Cmr3
MSNDTKTYLVKLKPLGPFFFGGEQGETADYYLKGSMFPQQTALLGLIRHQLLIQNNLLKNGVIADKPKAATLIGPESFQYDKEQYFGAIQRLSECYIGYTAKNKEEEFCTYLYHAAPQSYTRQAVQVNDDFVFPYYDPKNNYPAVFTLLKAAELCPPAFSEDDIFIEAGRPGIDKNYDGKPRDNAYYKQVWLKLKNDFCFAFYLTLREKFAENEAVILSSAMVTFGKESMPFMMEVTQPATIPDADKLPAGGQNALYLTSDAYLPADIAASCEAAVTDTVPFRNVINYTSQDKAAYFNRKPAQIPCSKRLQLYKRGSFFYAKDIAALAEKIKQQTAFTSIGYNTYRFTTINILS